MESHVGWQQRMLCCMVEEKIDHNSKSSDSFRRSAEIPEGIGTLRFFICRKGQDSRQDQWSGTFEIQGRRSPDGPQQQTGEGGDGGELPTLAAQWCWRLQLVDSFKFKFKVQLKLLLQSQVCMCLQLPRTYFREIWTIHFAMKSDEPRVLPGLISPKKIFEWSWTLLLRTCAQMGQCLEQEDLQDSCWCLLCKKANIQFRAFKLSCKM